MYMHTVLATNYSLFCFVSIQRQIIGIVEICETTNCRHATYTLFVLLYLHGRDFENTPPPRARPPKHTHTQFKKFEIDFEHMGSA